MSAEAQSDRRRWIALAVIVAAQFMVVLDVAIVNVALPSIKTDLHFTQESLQWIITAYAILFGGVLLLHNRAGRSPGPRRAAPARRGAPPSARHSTLRRARPRPAPRRTDAAGVRETAGAGGRGAHRHDDRAPGRVGRARARLRRDR